MGAEGCSRAYSEKAEGDHAGDLVDRGDSQATVQAEVLGALLLYMQAKCRN